MTARVRPYGERAWLVDVDDTDDVLPWVRAAAAIPDVVEVVPGWRSVLVVAADLAAVGAALSRVVVGRADVARESGAVRVIDVVYDGEDLDDVAATTGLPVAEVVRRHCAATYQVVMLGFTRGFPYLTGLDPVLAGVPRLSTPRVRVPAGSVAIAAGQAGIYPVAGPGGWRLLGRTGAPLFDPTREPPALLAAGDRVRFREVPS